MFISDQTIAPFSTDFFEFVWVECDKHYAPGWERNLHMDLIRALQGK